VGADHYLAVTLAPTSLVVTLPSGEKEVYMHTVEYCVLEGLDWSPQLKARNLCWYIWPSRVALLLQDLDAAALLEWSPVQSPTLLAVLLRDAIRQLPADKRELSLSHVHESTVPPAADQYFFDRVTAATLAGSDNNMALVIDFKSMMIDAYSPDHRDDDDSRYADMVGMVLSAAGKDLDDKSVAVQANKVAAFFRRTQLPANPKLRSYVPFEDQGAELARRESPTESGIFTPLLQQAWNDGRDCGYKELQLAFPSACNGVEMTRLLGVLATRVGLSADLTDATVVSVCNMLNDTVLAELDTAEFRNASNAARGKALGSILAAALAKGADPSAVANQPHLSKMYGSSDFKTLISDLEGHNTSSPDYDAVVKVMALHPVARIYLVHGRAAVKLFKQFVAARSAESLTSALNRVLAVDLDGSALGKVVIKPTLAGKLIAGKFAASHFDPWADLCKQVIAERDGKKAAQDESQAGNGAFWADWSRLELCQPIMESFFEFIGYSGRSSGTFKSFYSEQTKMARSIDKLPDDLRNKAGMKRMLIDVAIKALDLASLRDVTMLAEPFETATLPSPFVPPGSPAAEALATLKADYAKAKEDVRLRDAYDRPMDDAFEADSWANSSWQEDWSDWHSPAKESKLTSRATGDMLKKWGCYISSGGIVFGNKFLVSFPGDIPDIMQSSCLGSLCYVRNAARRHEWCNAASPCKDHPRPSGLQEADFKVVNLYASDFDSNADKELAAKVLSEKNGWIHFAGASNETVMGGQTGASGGGGSRQHSPRGRGKGGGQPQGRWSSGKGIAKSGKGKGKGKGKGAKGKGKPNFGRQQH
jgi:hypothetical protein